MRILLINNFHYRRGGADVVYLNTGKLLEKYGHEVFYFSMNHPQNISYKYAEYFPQATNYREISFLSKIKSVKSFLYNQEAYDKLTDYLRVIKPDIAHVHLFMGGLTVSILKALKENKIPIVHTVHDYRLICPAYTFLDRNNNICEKCRDGLFIRCAINKCSLEKNRVHSTILSLDAYYRKYYFKPIDYIDKFIFVSDFSKNLHISFNREFKRKAKQVYNFVTDFSKISNFKRGNYFLYYGRLSREKGINLLVEVAAELKIKLKIAGTGPLYNDLINKSDDNIEVLGFKSGNELWSLIQNSSFVILPSEWYENNPLSIIEAYSYGKPVIGSKIGGITELLQNERGIFFETKNKESLKKEIIKASNISEEEYQDYSNKVFKFAQDNFSESKHYQSLMEIYNSLTNAEKIS